MEQSNDKKLDLFLGSFACSGSGPFALGSAAYVVFRYESDIIGYWAAGGGLVLKGRRVRVAVR